MQENISLTIERLSDKHERDCRITSVLQIHSLLRDISEEGSSTALYYDGTKNFIITTLLDVGEKGLWVEQGADMKTNRLIAESRKISLVSSLNRVKVQFAVNTAREVMHQGYPAFYLPFPGKLYRVQRRECFRIAIPPSMHLYCVIPISKPHAQGKVEVPVIEISSGGIKLYHEGRNIDFVTGQTYEHCQIDLPETGKINFSITLKYLLTTSPKPGQTIKRIGCEFNNLNNACSILLQRHVTKMQRIKNDLKNSLLV